MQIIKIAWRNIFRNGRRTFLCGLGIAVGITCMITIDAFMIGMLDSMVNSATSTWTGHAQISNREFPDTSDIDLVLEQKDDLIALIKQQNSVQAYSERILAFSMLASGANVLPVQLVGVDVAKEAGLSKIKEAVITGEFASAITADRILLGEKLAKDLEVTMGDRVVVTASMAGGAGMVQRLFRVGGIFKFNMRQLDEAVAVIDIDEARKLLGFTSESHVVALKFADIPMPGIAPSFPEKIPGHDNRMRLWTEIIPSMSAMLGMSNISLTISAALLYLVVGLGIINSMFMAIHERIFEFGVLKAIGTRPIRLFNMITIEAFFIGLISAPIGMLGGFIVTLYFYKYGVDFSGTEFSGVTLKDPIYAVFRGYHYYVYPLGAVVLTTVAAVWPALHAARLIPGEAMRKSI